MATQLEEAKARVLAALQALSAYMNRPSSEPANDALYRKLSMELREAEEGYRVLLDKA